MKPKSRIMIGALVVIGLIITLLAAGEHGAQAQAGSIIYVDVDAVGRDDGTTWRNAYTDLQDALNEAEPLDQIWVAAGTYKPTRRLVDDDPRSATFQMVNGVAIFGGFDSEEMSPNLYKRDWVANETILSGDIGIEDDPSDNVYHVFYHPEDLALDISAFLDGFIITEGNADQEDPSGYQGYGGGMRNEGSSPMLTNVIFVSNSAAYGGGMSNDHASPILTNVTFVGNSAMYGGGIMVSAPFPNELTVTLTNVAFVGNLAGEGAGAYIDAAQTDPGDWELTFANCIFRDNAAERGGAVLVALGESDADTPLIRFTNCSVSGNQAELGGAFYVSKGPGEGWLEVTNSILWGDNPHEIYLEEGVGPPLVTFSDVQDGYEGEGNIDEHPGWVNPEGGDLHLQPGSVCIDSANNGSELAQYDIDGDLRILDGDGDGWAVVDMGVDEYKMPVIWVEINVTPDVPSNVIKLGSPRRVPVAILSTEEFDAVAEVAPDTVKFAGATHVGFTFVDVDNDGDVDVLLEFRARDMVDLNEDSTEATLTGFTLDGDVFEGTAEVKVIE